MKNEKRNKLGEEHIPPQVKGSKSMDNVRNTLVGWGAKLGLSYPQWKSLVKGLLDYHQ